MEYNTIDSPDAESRSTPEHGLPGAAPPPYSIFTTAQKRTIVFLTAYTSMFSPLSSFIYFPAITPIALSLHVSIELINLTITSYLIVAGIAPTLLGDMADMLGRRPTYLGMIAVYVAANLGLALQSSYAALLVLRMVQSFGASATIAIAYGIIADIATPAERGSYTGTVFLGPNIGPLLGPVLGGIIADNLGWRWIFLFLAILSGTCLILLALFLPETSRRIVGNGSLPAKGVHKSLFSAYSSGTASSTSTESEVLEKRKYQIPNPLTSLYIILHKNVGIIMVCHGLFYTTYSCIQASMSSLFIEVYDLTASQTGLMYLPCGIGSIIASYLSGKLMNRDYRKTAEAHNFTIDQLHGDDLSTFPIEKARLRSIWYLATLSGVFVLGYGWSVERRMNIIIPLCFQFFIAATFIGTFNTLSTLLVDLHPESPATSQASLNIVRCSLSAAGLAILQIVLDVMGPGWCFTLFSGLIFGTLPLLWMEYEWGMGWRLKDRKSTEEEPLLS